MNGIKASVDANWCATTSCPECRRSEDKSPIGSVFIAVFSVRFKEAPAREKLVGDIEVRVVLLTQVRVAVRLQVDGAHLRSQVRLRRDREEDDARADNSPSELFKGIAIAEV